MSRNGAGTYALPAGNPVVNGSTITDTWANTTLTDISTALTASISNDGQTPIVANIPMGSHKLTGLMAGSAFGDSVSLDANANLSQNNFVSGFSTTATAGTSTTLLASSAGLQFFTGTLAQLVILPLTSTLTIGQTFRVENNSTGIITIQSSGGNAVAVLLAGEMCIITCILTSGTSAASWDLDQPVNVSGNQTIAGVKTFSDATDATSSTAGGAIVSGGLAVAKKLNVGTLIDLSTATAGQIKFPATQNPSADANTLDDYEEGALSLTVSGIAGVTTVAARYVKVGRLVTLVFDTIYLEGVTNSAIKRITGISASLYPDIAINFFNGVSQNTRATVTLGRCVYATNGLMEFYSDGSATAWPATVTTCSVFLPPITYTCAA